MSNLKERILEYRWNTKIKKMKNDGENFFL